MSEQKTKTSKKQKAVTAAAVAKVLVLRTCNAELKAQYNGFQWPEKGHVEAPDFSSQKCCGYGLHGLLWGQGDGGLLNWDDSAQWLVVEVPADSIVELDGKVKFPKGEVVYCGNREGATQLIATQKPGPIVGLTAQSNAQSSTIAVGYRGTATAGEGGTATAGYRGTATAGKGGTLDLQWWDGKRYRRSLGYVGEDGIKVDTKYKLDNKGNFVEVPMAEVTP
jgi:hypothetical protein